ncbi:MAG TPA: prepilin-type N-terminal cleavage/methylation domain-containing protein [Gemmatimonadales bacterium]|nr:prepilin-type N-terminal cleavage/methylation domain-containing protein [Gemmatimonadales bacterium]
MLTATGRLRRTGFSLVEFVVVIAVMGLFSTAMVKLLLRQQRFYNSTAQLINTRQQIRQAAFMLPADLRGISRQASDIAVMTDSSIEIRSVFGTSIACMVNVAGSWVSTVPAQLLKGSAMTSWKVPPAVNDSVAIYDDGATIGEQDDSWRLARITAVALQTGDVANGCPSSSKLVQVADLTPSNPSYRLTISPAPVATTMQGAAMRFFRRVHYSLWKWPTDGRWYLAYYDCVPNRVPQCTSPQPIAGPLRPYASPGSSGLEFTYYDSTGAETANRTLVARIRVVVRGQGETAVNFTGAAPIPLRDSLRIEVGLRNRN